MPTTILDNESYLEALQRRYVEESRIDRKIEIISMAKSAGFFEFNVEGWVKEFERFAALVAAHAKQEYIDSVFEQHRETMFSNKDLGMLVDAVKAEREACAKVCEDLARAYWMSEAEEPMEFPDAHDCAAAIRARGEK